MGGQAVGVHPQGALRQPAMAGKDGGNTPGGVQGNEKAQGGSTLPAVHRQGGGRRGRGSGGETGGVPVQAYGHAEAPHGPEGGLHVGGKAEASHPAAAGQGRGDQQPVGGGFGGRGRQGSPDDGGGDDGEGHGGTPFVVSAAQEGGQLRQGEAVNKRVPNGTQQHQVDSRAGTLLIHGHGGKIIVHSIHIAYGTIVNEIKEVSRSYKEARMALDVGKIFFEEKEVIAYSALGIGRLIYQLPIPLCKMFIKEIFDGKSPDDFDEETLTTINKFFENSLNVSETSRQLYIHRNTLVYRLDKLQKSTRLDLRVFEDAITFKIALMVVKYMKYMESLDY